MSAQVITPSAAERPPNQPLKAAPADGDPDVEVAFALRWYVAEYQHLGPEDGPAPEPSYLLRQIRNLDHAQRLDVIVQQIAAARSALHMQPKAKAPEESSVADLKQAKGETLPTVDDVHLAILNSLMAQQEKVAKAYLAGVGVAETVIATYKITGQPGDSASGYGTADLTHLFDQTRIESLAGELRDLKSGFQPHAADAAAATLLDWGTWVRLKVQAPSVDASLDLSPEVRKALHSRLYF